MPEMTNPTKSDRLEVTSCTGHEHPNCNYLGFCGNFCSKCGQFLKCVAWMTEAPAATPEASTEALQGLVVDLRSLVSGKVMGQSTAAIVQRTQHSIAARIEAALRNADHSEGERVRCDNAITDADCTPDVGAGRPDRCYAHSGKMPAQPPVAAREAVCECGHKISYHTLENICTKLTEYKAYSHAKRCPCKEFHPPAAAQAGVTE